jgi:hypothetical protein
VWQYCFNWKTLSAMAGLTSWNFYFKLYSGAIRSPQVVDFLAALVRHIDRPLVVVWDRLAFTGLRLRVGGDRCGHA